MIDQSVYIRPTHKKSGMSNSKPVSTSIAEGIPIVIADDDDADAKLVDVRYFQAKIGSVMLATLCTHPNIAVAVQQLS